MQWKPILALGALACTTLGLGINCEGSIRCVEGGAKTDDATSLGADALPLIEAALVNGIKFHPHNMVYKSGGKSPPVSFIRGPQPFLFAYAGHCRAETHITSANRLHGGHLRLLPRRRQWNSG